MMDDKQGVNMGRLSMAMRQARLALRIYRDNRREAVRYFVGKNWSEDGAKERNPLQLLGLYASIVGRKLVSKDPRVMLSTFDKKIKPVVATMEDWTNKKFKQIGFAQVMQRIVLDSLFAVGIGKTALTSPGEANLGGYARMAGEPYFCSIDLDDAVWDVHARNLEEVSFVGHRFRAVLDVIKDSKLFGKERKKLEPSQDDPYNMDGDERINMLGRGYQASEEEFEDYVELWEIYLPRVGIVVTMREDSQEPLRVQKWVGPDCGPYLFLGMGDVPGNSFPKAPIMDLVDLHELVNRLYRKLGRQAERQKTVTAAAAGSEEAAAAICKADDGMSVKVDNPERIKEMRFGGVDQQNLGFAMHCVEKFSWQGGNLDVMGGLSPQAQTLGQERLLEQNSSSVVNDMQDRVVRYSENVIRNLLWFWWNDPFQTMRTTYQAGGAAGISYNRQITPEQRQQGKFEDLNIEIDPYSMTQATPSSRLQTLMQLVMQVVIPAMPMAEKQGVSLDLGAFLKKVAKYADQPDIEEILMFQNAQPEQTSGPPQDPNQQGGGSSYTSNAPASTTRTSVRRNVGVTTPGGRNQQLMDMMGGSGANGAPQPAGAAG